MKIKDYLKAASSLGASPKRAFWTVFFPLSVPGLAAGSLRVFVLCLGFYVTPAVLGGGKIIMVSMKIASNIELFVNWGAASALGVVLFVLTVLVLWVASRFVRLDKLSGGGIDDVVALTQCFGNTSDSHSAPVALRVLDSSDAVAAYSHTHCHPDVFLRFAVSGVSA